MADNLASPLSPGMEKRKYQYDEIVLSGEEELLHRKQVKDEVRTFLNCKLSISPIFLPKCQFLMADIVDLTLPLANEAAHPHTSRVPTSIEPDDVYCRPWNHDQHLRNLINNRTTTTSSGQVVAIYPTDPITWPTYMMLATASVSCAFNCVIMISYIWGVQTANRIDIYSSYYTYVVYLLNIGVWIATTTTFRMVQGAADQVPPPRDIWGWTCSDAIDDLVGEVKPRVNFDLQCQTQQVSFGVGLANAGLELFAVIIIVVTMRRAINKKQMELISQGLDSSFPEH